MTNKPLPIIGEWYKLSSKGEKYWAGPFYSWGPKKGDLLKVLVPWEVGEVSTKNHTTGTVFEIHRDGEIVDARIRLRCDSLFEKSAG